MGRKPNSDLEGCPDPGDDFDGCLTQLTENVVARVKRETAGMDHVQRRQYWLDQAKAGLATLRGFDTYVPEFLIEQAEARVARCEKELEAARLSKGDHQT